MPLRSSSPGFLLYYANVAALISAAIYASTMGTPAPYIAAGLCLFSLIAQDVFWLKACYLSPQDRQLIERITGMIQEKRTFELLWHYDLTKYSVYDRDLQNLKTMRDEWVGVDFEFQDRDCQRAWMEMQTHIDSLLQILGTHADYFNAHNFSITDPSAGERANDTAKQVLDRFERLRKIYIEKMPYGKGS